MKNYGYVKAKGRLIFVKNVEFIDIEESMSGMDVMTFRYEGEIFKSYIFRPWLLWGGSSTVRAEDS